MECQIYSKKKVIYQMFLSISVKETENVIEIWGIPSLGLVGEGDWGYFLVVVSLDRATDLRLS